MMWRWRQTLDDSLRNVRAQGLADKMVDTLPGFKG